MHFVTTLLDPFPDDVFHIYCIDFVQSPQVPDNAPDGNQMSYYASYLGIQFYI